MYILTPDQAKNNPGLVSFSCVLTDTDRGSRNLVPPICPDPKTKNIVYFQETLELEYMIEMIEEALIVLCMFQQESFRLMFLIAPVNNDRVGWREREQRLVFMNCRQTMTVL